MAVKIPQVPAAEAPVEPQPSLAVAASLFNPAALAPAPAAAAPAQAVAPAQPPAEAASGSDEVGFGKNGAKTYQEMWDDEPGYCVWVLRKHQELLESGEHTSEPWIPGDPKLKRLAQWVQKTDDECKERGPIMDYDAEMNPTERPNSLPLAQRVGTPTGSKFYGVASPTVGVYKSWEECKPFVHGVKGAKYKSFGTEEEAWEWAKNPPAVARKRKEGAEGEHPPAKKIKTKTPEEEEAAAKKKEEAAAKKAEKEQEKAAEKAAKEKEKQDARAEKSLAKFRESHQKEKDKEEAKAAKESAKQQAKTAKEEEKAAKQEAKEKTAKQGTKEQEKLAKQEAKASAATAASKKRKAAEDVAKAADEKDAEVSSPVAEGAAATQPADAAATEGTPSLAARVAGVATPVRAEKKAKTTPEKDPAPKVAKGRGKKEEEKKADAVAIEESILQEAKDLNYETALRNLAARPEIVAKGVDARAMLDALKSKEGLVNPAKHALLAQ